MSFWKKKAEDPVRASKDEAQPEAIAHTGQRLAWNIGAFALEALKPSAGDTLTSVEVWDAYKAWCGSAGAVPVAFGVFYAEFERLVADTGIGRRQIGAHVLYDDVALKVEQS